MKSILIIPVTLLLVLSLLFSGSDARTVTVGVYENEPMLFSDEYGKPSGFYIDLIEHIASAEGWKLSYVAGKRSECLAWLGEGKVDILPGIARKSGEDEYILTRVTVLADWGQVRSGSDSPVETIGDVSGKTVAVARGDLMYAEFRAAVEGLGFNCHFVEVDGYSDALRMVGEGVVDACLVPRLHVGRAAPGGLMRSALVGVPVDLRFAVGKGEGAATADVIDAHVAEMREDRGSPYYRAQHAWFGSLSVGRMSNWGNWAHVAAVSLLLVLILASVLSRIQMRRRTGRFRDEVAERKRAEEALRKSEERFHALYNKMNEGVCLHEMVFDETGHAVDYVVLDINPSYESILGLERDKVVGKRGRDLFDTADVPFMSAYADVAITERHTTFDAYFPPARRHFRVSAFSPQAGKVAAIFSDVTESKEEMDGLKTSEGKYRILFENAPDAMYLNDLSGTLIESNKAAEKLLGYQRQELIGENVLKAGLIPLEQTLKAANNISLCAQGKPTGPDEFTLIRKDGTQVQTEISTHPVKVDGQTLTLWIVRDLTGRKRVEYSIRESEEWLRSMYESMGDAVIITDLNGNIQRANTSAVSMLGYVSKDELIGSHSYLCVAEDDRQRASEDMMRALKMNECIVDEYIFLRKGGGTVACHVDVDLMRDRDGNAVGFVMLMQDVSERKEKEQAMLDDVSKYKSLLEGLEEAVFRVTLPIGKYDYVSPSVKRVFGYASDEFLKNPLLLRKMIHSDYAPCFNEMWKDLIQGHIQPSYEYKVVDREDRERWILQTNRRVFNEAGKVLAIEGVWRDVTEQKHVDDSTRENDEQFRSMFECSSTALELYDANRRLVNTNRACLELFGVNEIKDLRKLNLITHGSTPDEARARLDGGESARWQATLDFAALRTEGSLESRRSGRAHLEIVIGPVDMGHGSQPWYLAEIQNTSRYKALESQKQQPSSLDSAARLARAVARDFDNALTGIMGYSEHLSRELSGNESLRNEVEEIRKAAETAVTRTRQLLTFSRSAAIESAPLDINAMITECQPAINRTLGDDKNLEVKLDPSLGEVCADRGQLEAVLLSLTVNARDAMRSGQSLTIETRAVDIDDVSDESPDGPRSGHFARITVSDQGTGMEDHVLQHVFEPFFSTKEDAAGMGLSVVYGSVRQHGGWIDVSSEPEKGTEFSIYFPAQAVQKEETGREAAGTSDLHGSGERILVVEGDEIVRSMAAKALRDKGYSVSAVGSAVEARETFEAEHGGFDLVFCDIVLPDANGLHLADELRSASPDLKVLLTSGYADTQCQMAHIGERGFLLLEKPYALFDLLTAIKDSLEMHIAPAHGVRS